MMCDRETCPDYPDCASCFEDAAYEAYRDEKMLYGDEEP